MCHCHDWSLLTVVWLQSCSGSESANTSARSVANAPPEIAQQNGSTESFSNNVDDAPSPSSQHILDSALAGRLPLRFVLPFKKQNGSAYTISGVGIGTGDNSDGISVSSDFIVGADLSSTVEPFKARRRDKV